MLQKKKTGRKVSPKKVVYKSFRPSYNAHPVFHILVTVILLSLIGLILYSFIIMQQAFRSWDSTVPAVVSPTPTLSVDTSNWKTYADQILHYKVKYPYNYSITNEGANTMAFMSPLNPNRGRGFELQNGELKIEIGSQRYIPFNGTIDDYIKQNSSKTPALIKVSINGLTAAYYKDTLPSGGEVYTLVHNKQLIFITKFPLITSSQRQTEFNQILSTFKFTN